MKKITFSIAFLLLTTMVFSQFNTSNLINENSHNNCYISDYSLKKNSFKNSEDCDPSLVHYLKRPPIVSSYIVAEDRNEKIELVLKDVYTFNQIEIEFKEYTKYGQEDRVNTYIMHDDGTHGDEIANDKTYTNNEISLKHFTTNSYVFKYVRLTVIYKNSDVVAHTELFSLQYISLNTDFINEIDMPNTYKFENNDYLFTDKFIYYNKYNNWGELSCNQYGGVFPDDIISKSLLYDFWGQSVIDNSNDKNLYMQVDFSSPSGQFLAGQDMALGINSLGGVQIHEILHLWIPKINDYLGFDYADSHNGHHANIFKNTSGFLYSTWSRVNGVFCENSLNDIGEDIGGKYLYVDYRTSYELCNDELNNGDKTYYNDYELYLMNIITIDEVNFPLTFLKNISKTEEEIDPNSGFLVGKKYYFESILEINKEELISAKERMLSDFGNPPYLDASIPNNFILTFSGNKSNLSENEIKMLWLLSEDLTTKNEAIRDDFDYQIAPTFYEATGKRAEITSNIPLPKQYTGNFYTTEYITINDNENYNGWTGNGIYERTLSSTQYKDSIVTTHLKVITLQIDDDGDGVMNDVDTCPDTPTGEEVDTTGCSQSQIDDDGDGVMNDVDTCPDTPTGEEVDTTGCSQSQIDDDGDGVMNDVDTCPDTPTGEEVDTTGCSQSQIDDDGDGVMNDVDTCPDTPTGEEVDTTGCSQSQIDDDGDGVMNDVDTCPDTPTGEEVDTTGCSQSQIDDDGDGVMNDVDTCPDTPTGEEVDTTGCSQSQIDDDGDGVMNDVDTCPDTPTGEEVDTTGCSQSQIDDDGDGVMNDVDTCPDTPTGEEVDTTGCSQSQIDDDGDGVMNDVDTCPDTPTGEEVDTTGCSQSQIDDDGDGVMNDIDLCPNTTVGTTVNENGCFFLPSNNFDIEVTSETCPNKNNGELVITANETHSYTATINNVNHNFTNNNLTVSNLAPDTYSVCISVSGETFEQCYTIVIAEGTTVSGKASVTSNKASIAIEQGTAPYDIYVNGISVLNTLSPSFTIDVKHGDLLEVKTAISCEGIFLKAIDLFENIIAYPNPSKGIFEITLPISEKEVVIELYTIGSQLISKETYQVVNGKVQINLENKPTGMYVVKIHLDTLVNLTIIKE